MDNQEEKRICGLEIEVRAINEKLTALYLSNHQYRELTERAVLKAEAEMNRRLEGMNEFRGQLERQSVTFITRDQIDAARSGYEIAIKQAIEKFETLIQNNTERVERMQVALTKLEGRVSTSESADAVGENTALRLGAVENNMSNWNGRLYILGIVWGAFIVFLSLFVSWWLNHYN